MKVSILVTGDSGVGKSSLINALVGVDVAKTGGNVTGVTTTIQTISMTRNGINMNIIDTPGFGDMDMDYEDIVQKIIQESGQIDLLLFCLRITDRLLLSNLEEMKIIRNVLGEDVWKRAVFVLTFANEYNKSGKEKEFNDKLNNWERDLKKRMKKIIDPEIAEKIPIVPTGYKELHLPDRPNWLSEFWIQGFRRMGFRAMVKLMLINKERAQNSANYMKPSQDMYGNLFPCHMSKEKKWIIPKQYRAVFQLVGAAIGGLATVSTGSPQAIYNGMHYGQLIGNLTTNLVLNIMGITDENPDDVNCYKDVITKILIAAFMEEYPEYSFEPPKDEL